MGMLCLLGLYHKKLQRVQNTAARVIAGLGKYDHVTMTLHELHWLPVDMKIKYKILLLTYKALNGLAPSYISDLLVLHSELRYLKSRGQSHLAPPHTKRGYGDKCFTVFTEPQLWNGIHDSLKCTPTVNAFKCHLKNICSELLVIVHLSDVCLDYMVYADESQIYTVFRPSTIYITINLPLGNVLLQSTLSNVILKTFVAFIYYLCLQHIELFYVYALYKNKIKSNQIPTQIALK